MGTTEVDRAEAPQGVKGPRERPAPLTVAEASEGLFCCPLDVRSEDVVFVKGVLEASEGIAVLLAESGGRLTLATPHEQRESLTALVEDLRFELRLEPGEAL